MMDEFHKWLDFVEEMAKSILEVVKNFDKVQLIPKQGLHERISLNMLKLYTMPENHFTSMILLI